MTNASDQLFCKCCQRLANIPEGHVLCSVCFEQHIMEAEALEGRAPTGVAVRMAEVDAAEKYFSSRLGHGLDLPKQAT